MVPVEAVVAGAATKEVLAASRDRQTMAPAKPGGLTSSAVWVMSGWHLVAALQRSVVAGSANALKLDYSRLEGLGENVSVTESDA